MTKQTVHEQVLEFHRGFDLPVAGSPAVPADDRVRLRMKLIAEEFFETLEATFAENGDDGIRRLVQARTMTSIAIESMPIKVDLVEFADGLGDLDYVIEGARLEFGINGEPIADEIHRTNMAKLGGEIRSDGKRLKPPGWSPPDIAGELEKQKNGEGSLYTQHSHLKKEKENVGK